MKAIHNSYGKAFTFKCVVINRKTTKFESNSQRNLTSYKILNSCYQSQNYKIWKQFTTNVIGCLATGMLLSIAKLQNLKAIHNLPVLLLLPKCVVINRKTTKFESNSQPSLTSRIYTSSCYQSQNYKIWKQFTTVGCNGIGMLKLLSITKLQNLKAIHNGYICERSRLCVVINRKTTKFESNSQRTFITTQIINGCYQSQNYKIWKQFTTIYGRGFALESCYQSQNYKIWKQFTTVRATEEVKIVLLSIAKLQNLKAIHNYEYFRKSEKSVVINRKTTKFESNSQHSSFWYFLSYCCYQSQNYKIWKQFTIIYSLFCLPYCVNRDKLTRRQRFKIANVLLSLHSKIVSLWKIIF